MSESNRQNNEIFSPQQAAAAGFQTRNIMKDDFAYEVPVESVPVPSCGRVYPVDSPLYGQETVEIRAMTAKEEDILTSRALIKKGTVITQLIKSCLINKSIDVDSMIVGDRNAIMTALRITGYGADYKCEVECPECGEKSKNDFSLSELPIKRLEIDPVAEGANLFEFMLPVSKKKVQFKFLTGNDETEIAAEQERKKKMGQTDSNFITTRLVHTIVSIDNIKDKSKLAMFIKNMPARDSLVLRKYIDDSEPGLEMKAQLVCPLCSESSEVRLPIGATFFWPDA